MHRQRTKSRKPARPPFTTVYADGRGGEIRYHFELETLEALLDGRHVGYPRTESDGVRLISDARLALSGIRHR